VQRRLLDQLVQVPLEHAIELVQREAEPMVRHPVLREVVGPDALAAPSGPDLAAPFARPLLLGAVSLLIEQTRPQDLERARLVLVLRLLVLAGHHQPAG
jgi:hypothetical protein